MIGWAALADGLRRSDVRSFGPAGRVALAKAALVGGVTALVVDTTDPKPDPVLAIGGMRYVFVAAGRVLPWLRAPSRCFSLAATATTTV